jgi:hypothetical protein
MREQMGSGSRNNLWKILIGLAIVCGLLVFAGGFFHRRALEQSVQDAQDASALYVRTKLSHDVQGLDLSEPLNDRQSSALAKDVDAPGDAGVRIFAPNGTPVFTEGVDAFPADDEALSTAKAGGISRVIDGSDLRVYTPVDGKGPVDSVAVVVSNYTAMRKAANGPLDDFRLPLVGLGVVLLIIGVVLMLQATKGSAPVTAPIAKVVAPPRPAKGRVTGFDEPGATPVAPPAEPATQAAAVQLQAAVSHASASLMGAATVEGEEQPAKKRFSFGKKSAAETPEAAADEAPKEKRSIFGRKAAPAPAEPAAAPAPADASALQREIAIREALEDQLEQLRTQVKTQQDERAAATRELSAQLDEATRRAEHAEGELQAVGGAAVPGSADRVAALEQELARSKAAAADAIARAEQLQREAAVAPPPAPAPDPAADQRLAELRAQLTDAQQRASSAEQRAASVESVRDELEVRVAQLGAKATELEQRAAGLEANLQEANAGGDAVRAEIATLTAALAAANARVQELESLPTSPSPAPEHEAELARLRGELAKQLERAQSAEDRIASLEADVLAAQRGVRSLPTDQPARALEEQPTEAVPPAPATQDRYDDVWSTPYVPAAMEADRPAEPAGSAPASSEPEPSPDRNGHAEPEPETVASSEPAEESHEEDVAADDMWSLRARLADAAARKKHHQI